MAHKYLHIENIFNNISLLYLLYPLMCLLLLCRRPDAIFNPQPWAEDGVIFIHDVFCYSFNSLLIPYAGYHHLLARIVTYVSITISPVYGILFMNLFSLLMSVLILFFFLDPLFRSIIKNDLLRLLWVILVICTPISEVYMNISYFQWFPPIFLILYCLVLFFNYDGLINRGKHFQAGLIFFASVCGIASSLSIIVIPPFLYLLYHSWSHSQKKDITRNHLTWLIPFFISIIFFVINSIIVEKIRDNVNWINTSTIMNYIFLFINKLFILKYFLLFLVLFLLTLLFLAILCIQLNERNFSFIYALLSSLIFYCLIVVITRTDLIIPILFSISNGGTRYIFIPFAIILLILIRYIDQYKGGFLWSFSLIFLILVIGVCGYSYFLTPFIDYHYLDIISNHIYGNGTGSIPINPAPWSMTISCH